MNDLGECIIIFAIVGLVGAIPVVFCVGLFELVNWIEKRRENNE